MASAGRARLSIDLTPELRKQLREAAAAADRTMREMALAGIQQQIASVNRSRSTGMSATPQLTATRQASKQRADQVAELQERVAELARQVSPTLVEELAAIQQDVAQQLDTTEQECLETVRAMTEEYLTATGATPAREAAVGLAEQQQQAVCAALDEMRTTYQAALARAEADQLAAIRRALDPFARDWDSEEDAVYDELD